MRLYDSLYSALTGDVNHAVGIGAKHEGLVYAVLGIGGVLDDLGVGGLYEHYAEHLAQFAVIYLLRIAVFGNVLPEGIALKVVYGVGVNYADIVGLAALAGELTRLVLLEGANCLAYLTYGELLGGGYIVVAGLAVGVLYIGCSGHSVADYHVQNVTKLLTKQFGRIGNYVVYRGQVEQVGYFHVCAVLLYSGGDRRHGEILCGGGGALGQGLGRGISSEQGPAAELHGFTVVLRYAALLGIISENKLGLRPLKHFPVIVGLHSGGKAGSSSYHGCHSD